MQGEGDPCRCCSQDKTGEIRITQIAQDHCAGSGRGCEENSGSEVGFGDFEQNHIDTGHRHR